MLSKTQPAFADIGFPTQMVLGVATVLPFNLFMGGLTPALPNKRGKSFAPLVNEGGLRTASGGRCNLKKG